MVSITDKNINGRETVQSVSLELEKAVAAFAESVDMQPHMAA